MRFFVALDIPEQSKYELARIQDQIKEFIPEAHLTDPDKLHLTIAFVGEQDEKFKFELLDILKKAALGIPAFSVTPSYIDGFPHLHTAATLWVGVKGDIDKLYELRHHIKDGLQSLQLPVDQRRFVPHIAIVKLEHFHLQPEVEAKLEEIMSVKLSPVVVSSVKLFESIPDHGFHSHNTLAEIKLA